MLYYQKHFIVKNKNPAVLGVTERVREFSEIYKFQTKQTKKHV